MTAYERGQAAARRGKPGVPPLDIETDAEAEAWKQGYWHERQYQLVRGALKVTAVGRFQW